VNDFVPDPFLIKGTKETIDRILQAVAKKEKIILFGDADPDGVASVIILKEALETLGNPPFFVYFPNREKEGYGLNKKALNFLRDKSPALLITLDCGIGNFEEIEMAQNFGFEVIVIDHHEILNNLPKASIIINPKQKNDQYPFKRLCTAGIVYKLAKLLLFEAQKSFLPESFLELVAIATIADQMPLIGENERILKEGLLALGFTKRIGLKALMEISGFEDFTIKEIREKIIPPLVSANLKKHQNESYLLLTENSSREARKIAETLFKKQKMRSERIREIFEEAKEKINPALPIVFLGRESWPLTLTGTIAAKICQRYQKPTFIFKIEKTKSQGSARTPKEINSVKMMKKCSHLLETYGGHPQASGFRLKNENLESFKECLISSLKGRIN